MCQIEIACLQLSLAKEENEARITESIQKIFARRKR